MRGVNNIRQFFARADRYLGQHHVVATGWLPGVGRITIHHHRAPAMHKSDLTNYIADTAGLPKVATAKAVDAVFEAITAALAKGEEVAFKGFGVFSVVDRAAREGRNPRTGEPVPIPASKAPKFTAAKALKGAVQG